MADDARSSFLACLRNYRYVKIKFKEEFEMSERWHSKMFRWLVRREAHVAIVGLAGTILAIVVSIFALVVTVLIYFDQKENDTVDKAKIAASDFCKMITIDPVATFVMNEIRGRGINKKIRNNDEGSLQDQDYVYIYRQLNLLEYGAVVFYNFDMRNNEGGIIFSNCSCSFYRNASDLYLKTQRLKSYPGLKFLHKLVDDEEFWTRPSACGCGWYDEAAPGVNPQSRHIVGSSYRGLVCRLRQEGFLFAPSKEVGNGSP